MRFGITRQVIGPQPFLELPEGEYRAVITAQRNVLTMLAIEEKFDALLQNYAEYEQELLSIALNHSLFRNHDWSDGIGDLQTMNRRLANVLTMARVYVDHVPQEVGKIYGRDSANGDKLIDAFRGAYDASIGYRVMEALRNHIQHRAFPIRSISYPSEWQGDITSIQARLRTRIVPCLDMEGLRGSSGFKASVLMELEQCAPKDRDVTSFLREYLEHLGRAHDSLRSICVDVVEWRKVIVEIRARYSTIEGAQILGTVAVAENDEKEWLEKTTIFEEPIQRLDYLRSKNRLLINLSRRYVSNEKD